MSQELKPCPLCNYPLLLSNDHTWWIHSWNEQCCLDPVRIKADDEARIAAWNTRASDSRIADLESEVSARGIEAHQMRAERDAAKADAANWYRLHDELEADVEKLRMRLDAMLGLLDAAKTVLEWMNQLPIPTEGCTAKGMLLYRAISKVQP